DQPPRHRLPLRGRRRRGGPRPRRGGQRADGRRGAAARPGHLGRPRRHRRRAPARALRQGRGPGGPLAGGPPALPRRRPRLRPRPRLAGRGLPRRREAPQGGRVRMSLVRLRRLQADFLKLQEYVRRHPRVQLVQHDGDPPERYQVRYRIRSLRQKDDELTEVSDHLVEILLPRNYPRTPPQCRMLTPVFHPNIAPHAICIGDHWSAGEALSSLVARIGEMLAYQSYNTKSPLNGEAAKWVDQNVARLPLDAVNMHLEDNTPAGASSVPTKPPISMIPPPLP